MITNTNQNKKQIIQYTQNKDNSITLYGLCRFYVSCINEIKNNYIEILNITNPSRCNEELQKYKPYIIICKDNPVFEDVFSHLLCEASKYYVIHKGDAKEFKQWFMPKFEQFIKFNYKYSFNDKKVGGAVDILNFNLLDSCLGLFEGVFDRDGFIKVNYSFGVDVSECNVLVFLCDPLSNKHLSTLQVWHNEHMGELELPVTVENVREIFKDYTVSLKKKCLKCGVLGCVRGKWLCLECLVKVKKRSIEMSIVSNRKNMVDGNLSLRD